MVHSPRPRRPGITSDGPPLWVGSAEKPRPDTRTILWEARTASSAAEGEQWPLRNTKDIGLKRPKPLASGARRLAVRIVWTSGSEVAGISSLGRGRIQRSVRRWNAHTNLSTLTR